MTSDSNQMETDGSIPPSFDDILNSPITFTNPAPVYNRLRPYSPFEFTYIDASTSHSFRSWAVMRHADVEQVLKDHSTFSSAKHPLAEKGVIPALTLIHDDQPRHSRLRALINPVFSHSPVHSYRPAIMQIAAELMDGIENAEFDAMSRIAIPLPLRVIARLLGVPPAKYASLFEWSRAFLSVPGMRSEERRRLVNEMIECFSAQLRIYRAGKLATDQDTLFVRIANACVDDARLTDNEVIGFCVILLVAGNETTVNLIGNALNVFAHNHDLWRELEADRSRLHSAIDEILRIESPVQRHVRRAMRDTRIRNQAIRNGDYLTVFFGAANRDPDVFDDPSAFRLDRDQQKSMSFGAGIHYCIGASLARLEAEIVFSMLLDRGIDIVPGNGASKRQDQSSTTLGFEFLPILIRKRV